jgi:hypothetical protein
MFSTGSRLLHLGPDPRNKECCSPDTRVADGDYPSDQSVATRPRDRIELQVRSEREEEQAPRLVSPDDVRAASHRWFCSPAKAIRELGFKTSPLSATIADTLADHAQTTTA